MAIKVTPARAAAFEILREIERERAFSAVLLPAYEENLKPDDRALCHALTLGVLRNQIFLDRTIERFSGRKIEKLDLEVKIVLRLALFQLQFLTKIPARAAVNEAVNQIYQARKRSAAGFVNAVLRKIEPDFNPSATIENPVEKLSVETSHPLWLVKKWIEAFGFEDAAALARTNNTAPPVAFRFAGAADERLLDELRKAGAEVAASKIVADAWRVSGANPKLRELVAAGKIYIQDEASQLVARQIQSVNENFESFLDVCAAPGSKTTLVSSLKSQTQSSQLSVAGDFSTIRIKILRETVKKFGAGKIEIVQYDATQHLPFADASFGCVLVDAPCSGTGTIRHNPEIRWHLRENDLADLAVKQSAILENAARTVKKDGRLIYSTCSLEREENEAVADNFLRRNGDFKLIAPKLSARFLTATGAARTFPPRDDTDGFFIAVFQR